MSRRLLLSSPVAGEVAAKRPERAAIWAVAKPVDVLEPARVNRSEAMLKNAAL